LNSKVRGGGGDMQLRRVRERPSRAIGQLLTVFILFLLHSALCHLRFVFHLHYYFFILRGCWPLLTSYFNWFVLCIRSSVLYSYLQLDLAIRTLCWLYISCLMILSGYLIGVPETRKKKPLIFFRWFIVIVIAWTGY
jgi:hypothetical protein